MKFSFSSSLAVATTLLAHANAITLSTSAAAYTVNVESSNTFQVTFNRKSCDITSLKYIGSEVQSQAKFSHIGSGLGTATVSAAEIAIGGVKYVKVTCATPTLTHYYALRDADTTLFMATHRTEQPSIGELRWIARLNQNLLPNDDVNQASDTSDGTTVEGSDVFLINGQTRSKFYSSQRFIDDKVHCLSGPTMKACMVIPGVATEASSGGPFFRDINMNPGGYSTLYWYMNSGHAQTEAYRMGLSGPYALVFSRSGSPSGNLDLSFFSGLSIKGYVASAGRGRVNGKAIGIDGSKFQIVLHWFSADAQYWVYANASSSNFASPGMKPGNYTMVLYQQEFKVATSSVTVTAGAVTQQNIRSGVTAPAQTLFQIGEWDGQPTGFRNADKQLRMHPSDQRMASWGPLTYTVGSSPLTDFPMAVWKGVNDPVTIKVTLTAAQAAGAATLRVGTTLSFAGARPVVSVNGKSGTTPAAPQVIDSRGVTRGAYRGRGDVYDFAVGAGGLVTGVNTITIGVASGSGGGGGFLSPNVIFDAIHLFR